ncbi:uncharacterized protein LOC126723250 isoform X2 [Quercus robur]|uniref:uncharacterized protein LOC126723250 isoform X2 n=1 Tax=Quercus robur TaxID=38942 RepID=UPI002163C8D8|nr:uncharacterized protein LOC126723250 isoform X2 [Quercus robur]
MAHQHWFLKHRMIGNLEEYRDSVRECRCHHQIIKLSKLAPMVVTWQRSGLLKNISTQSASLISLKFTMGSCLATIGIVLSYTPLFSIGVLNYYLQTRQTESTHGCPIQ